MDKIERIMAALPKTRDGQVKVAGSDDPELGYAWIITSNREFLSLRVFSKTECNTTKYGIYFFDEWWDLHHCFSSAEAAEKHLREEAPKRLVSQMKRGDFFILNDVIYMIMSIPIDCISGEVKIISVKSQDFYYICPRTRVLPVNASFDPIREC